MQYTELAPAEMALAAMNNFELAGRQRELLRCLAGPTLLMPTASPQSESRRSTNGARALRSRWACRACRPRSWTRGRADTVRLNSVELEESPLITPSHISGPKMDNMARQSLMYKLARQPDPAAAPSILSSRPQPAP